MSGEGIQQLLFFGLIALVFYFFLIRPQQTRAAQQKAFRDALKVGDRVVTIGGLHGRISRLDETTVELEVDRGLKLTFDKSAVSSAPGEKAAS